VPQDDSSSQQFSWQVIRSLLYSGVGTTVSKVLNVVALLVVLKLISTAAFGIASIVLALFTILRAATEMGLGKAIVQAQEITQREIHSLFWISLALAVGMYLALVAAAPLVAWFYGEPQVTALIRVFGLSIVLFPFYFVPKSRLKKEMRFGPIVFAENASLLASAVLMVTLAAYGYGAWSIILGELGVHVGRLVLFHVFRPYVPRFYFNWKEVKPRVSFGLYATGSRLLYNFYINSDYLIVGRVFGAEAVGIYTLAYRIISDPVNTLAGTINDVTYPAFAKLQNQLERLRTYFYTIARASLALIGLVLVIVAVYAGDLLVVGGYEKYLDAVPLIRVFALIGVLRCVSPIVPQLLNAVGRAQLNFYYSLSNSILMPIAFLVGAQISLAGVAWAWVIGYPVVVILLFHFGARVLETSLPVMLGKIAAGGLVLVPTLGVALGLRAATDAYLPGRPVLALALGVLVTLGVGLGLAYVSERDTIAVLRGRYSAVDA
jgi:O-antigen/teichoic acid export membrane protein